jgi:hypothetical protein
MQSLEAASQQVHDFFQRPAVEAGRRQIQSMIESGLVLQAASPLVITAYLATEAVRGWICDQDRGISRKSNDHRRRTAYRPLSAAVNVSITLLVGYSGLFAYRTWQAPTWEAALRPGLMAAGCLSGQALLTRFTERVDQPVADYEEPRSGLERASEKLKDFCGPVGKVAEFTRMGKVAALTRNVMLYSLVIQADVPMQIAWSASLVGVYWRCEEDEPPFMGRFRPLNAATSVATWILLGYSGLFAHQAWQASTLQAALRPIGISVGAVAAIVATNFVADTV